MASARLMLYLSLIHIYVPHHAAHDDDEPLPGGFGAIFPRLGGLFEGFGVHGFVHHARYFAITAQRKPADTVFLSLLHIFCNSSIHKICNGLTVRRSTCRKIRRRAWRLSLIHIYLKGALLQKARFLLVKLSPMLDIRATLKLFPETAQVHVVALRNEVNELLFLLERDFSGQVEVSAADLGKDGVADVFSASAARMNAPAAVSPMKRYVYDPSAALRKAGLAEAYCAERGLEKLHPNTSLYTSDELAADFRGRVFLSLIHIWWWAASISERVGTIPCWLWAYWIR